MKALPTEVFRIYMGGDIETAKRYLRQDCLRNPICVTIEPTTFIYTGGEEAGFVVGLLAYPRFPAEPGALAERAYVMAMALRSECAQRTALIVGPEFTEWLPVEEPS